MQFHFMNDCFERIKEESIHNKRNDSHEEDDDDDDDDDDDEDDEDVDENGETESGTCWEISKVMMKRATNHRILKTWVYNANAAVYPQYNAEECWLILDFSLKRFTM